MKNGDFRLTVEWLRCGQPRPYADTIREFILTTEWIPYGKKNGIIITEFEPTKWVESVILDCAQGICKFKLPGERKEWHQSYLESIKNIGPGKWQIKIIEPFTD